MPDVEAQDAEIKVTLSGRVDAAIGALGLDDGAAWQIWFCEDLAPPPGTTTPLLDAGVILRARRKAGDDHDATVKLRPALRDYAAKHPSQPQQLPEYLRAYFEPNGEQPLDPDLDADAESEQGDQPGDGNGDEEQ